MTVLTKEARRLKRRRRVRAKVVGTAERPRISVFRSNRGISVQLIDDLNGKTLAAVQWTEFRGVAKSDQAEQVGELAAYIRKQRPPEPYKGKGIRYQGEYVARKVGKRA